MGVMTEKLMKDFNDAVAIDRGITVGTIDMVEGTHALGDVIKWLIIDIHTLDKNGAYYKEVCEKRDSLNEESRKRKEKIVNSSKTPNDPIEERDLQYRLLHVDFERLKNLLAVIQCISYEQGWFK